jgi:DNA-binding SARP family transcriptional activator
MEYTFSLTNLTKRIMPRYRGDHNQAHAAEFTTQGGGKTVGGQAATRDAELVPVVDWQTVAQVVCHQAAGLAAQGRMQTLEGRLRRLPRQVLEANPWLLYWSGACCLPLNPEQGRADFEQAYLSFHDQALRGTHQDISGMLSAWVGIVDSILLSRTDFSPLARWVAALDEILRNHPTFPSLELEAHVTQAMLGALTQYQPSPAAPAPVASSVSSSTPVTYLSSSRGEEYQKRSHHLDVAFWEQRARQLLHCGLEVNTQFILGNRLFLHCLHKGDTAATSWVLHTLKAQAGNPSAAIQVEWQASQALYNLLHISADACLDAVTEGLEIARNSGTHSSDFKLYALGVQAALVKGSHEAAQGFLGNLGTLLIATRHLDASHYHYLLAWSSASQYDLPSATDHARLALTLAEAAAAPYAQALCHALLAQVLFEYGGRREALRHLMQARRYASATQDKYVEYLALLQESQFRFIGSFDMQEYAGGGRSPFLGAGVSRFGARTAGNRGVFALGKAFVLARKHGYASMSTLRPCAIAMLCKKALENGIEVEYVRHYIKKHGLQPPAPSVECQDWPWPIKIYTLGNFRIVKAGESLDFEGQERSKAQGKPLMLLKALIALGGRDVNETQLIDALWPDAEGDAGHQVFRITLHRLRQMLGHEKVIIMRDNSLTLDASCCWVDVWALERFFGQPPATPAASSFMEKILKIYQGHFLGDDNEYAWALALRERLRSKLLRYLEHTGKQSENSGQWEIAVNSYRKGLEIDPLAEILYQRLMLCYQRQGRCAEALAVYQRCHTVFSTVLGVAPSSHIEEARRAVISR